MNDSADKDDGALARAQKFLTEALDKDHKKQLESLLSFAAVGDEKALAEVEDRFRGTLRFGTAGLRGALGPGTARMNRVTVIKACYGLGRALLADDEAAAKKRGVVIGFDARRMSRQFAEDSAGVLSAMGIVVHVFDTIVPTPVLAFAALELGCVAGIMVTASHNPPKDNGYKVYWKNGAQIIPPVDADIAQHIAAAPEVGAIARLTRNAAEEKGLLQPVEPAVTGRYYATLDEDTGTERAHHGSVRAVYTAMHGTGHGPVMRALRAAGFRGVTSVPSQAEPDGAFPTVAFPNPEEKGALDIAFSLAGEVGADFVLANDPDADRLAVGVRGRDGGAFTRLSGNQVGVLLADFLLRRHAASKDKARPLVLTTLVSSSMLSRMAEGANALFKETLTGFKWIANNAIALEAEHKARFVFGYEEALGYACGPRVRDKDGVSALLRMCELLASLNGQKRTVWDALDDLAVAHGLSEDRSWSVKEPGAEGRERLAALMTAFREDPPSHIAGEKVVRTRDLLAGTDTDGPDGKSETSGADVLTYWTRDGMRLTVRPSGTEPKVKFYLDAACPAPDLGSLPELREKLGRRIRSAQEDIAGRLRR